MDAVAAVVGRTGGPVPATRSTAASSATDDVVPVPVPARQEARVDTVEISGQSMALSRLYHGTPVTYTPDAGPASGSIFGFLTSADRDTMASLYDYAQANGIDPIKVDNIAYDLGNYRSSVVRDDGPATMYDQDGQLLPITFSDSEETVARRILTSKAVKDSSLPEDFLRYELTPATGTPKAADFSFLEQVTYATSGTGSDGATDPTAVLQPRSVEYFRSLQAARGELLTPEQVKRLVAAQLAQPPSFDDYADRVKRLAPFLSTGDKDMLATLYAAISDQHGPTSPRLKSVDQLARTLAAVHLAQVRLTQKGVYK